MHVDYAFPATVLICLALLVGVTVGCGDEPNGDAAPAATAPPETDAQEEASPVPAADEADAHPDEAADEEAEGEVERITADEDEEDAEAEDVADADAEERPAVDEELARRHIGGWIVEDGQRNNARFIFLDDGRAQMGTDVIMFSGDYTIDLDRDPPYLHHRLEVMDRVVETHFLVEYVSEDRIRLHPAVIDETVPGGLRVQDPHGSLLLVRDE